MKYFYKIIGIISILMLLSSCFDTSGNNINAKDLSFNNLDKVPVLASKNTKSSIFLSNNTNEEITNIKYSINNENIITSDNKDSHVEILNACSTIKPYSICKLEINVPPLELSSLGGSFIISANYNSKKQKYTTNQLVNLDIIRGSDSGSAQFASSYEPFTSHSYTAYLYSTSNNISYEIESSSLNAGDGVHILSIESKLNPNEVMPIQITKPNDITENITLTLYLKNTKTGERFSLSKPIMQQPNGNTAVLIAATIPITQYNSSSTGSKSLMIYNIGNGVATITHTIESNILAPGLSYITINTSATTCSTTLTQQNSCKIVYSINNNAPMSLTTDYIQVLYTGGVNPSNFLLAPVIWYSNSGGPILSVSLPISNLSASPLGSQIATVNITNSGNYPMSTFVESIVSYASLDISSFTYPSAANTCTGTLLPGASCSFNININFATAVNLFNYFLLKISANYPGSSTPYNTYVPIYYTIFNGWAGGVATKIDYSSATIPHSLSINPYNNTPYTVYESGNGGNLFVQKYSPSGWLKTPSSSPNIGGIPSINGLYSSVQFDNNGFAYIAYADSTQGNKVVVKYESNSTWQNFAGGAVSTSSIIGATNPKILLTISNNIMYLAYTESNNTLSIYKYNITTKSGWTKQNTNFMPNNFSILENMSIINGLCYISYISTNNKLTMINNEGITAPTDAVWQYTGNQDFTSITIKSSTSEIVGSSSGQLYVSIVESGSQQILSYMYNLGVWSLMPGGNINKTSAIGSNVTMAYYSGLVYLGYNESNGDFVLQSNNNISWLLNSRSTAASLGYSGNAIINPHLRVVIGNLYLIETNATQNFGYALSYDYVSLKWGFLGSTQILPNTYSKAFYMLSNPVNEVLYAVYVNSLGNIAVSSYNQNYGWIQKNIPTFGVSLNVAVPIFSKAGILYYGFLIESNTLNGQPYCSQVRSTGNCFMIESYNTLNDTNEILVTQNTFYNIPGHTGYQSISLGYNEYDLPESALYSAILGSNLTYGAGYYSVFVNTYIGNKTWLGNISYTGNSPILTSMFELAPKMTFYKRDSFMISGAAASYTMFVGNCDRANWYRCTANKSLGLSTDTTYSITSNPYSLGSLYIAYVDRTSHKLNVKTCDATSTTPTCENIGIADFSKPVYKFCQGGAASCNNKSTDWTSESGLVAYVSPIVYSNNKLFIAMAESGTNNITVYSNDVKNNVKTNPWTIVGASNFNQYTVSTTGVYSMPLALSATTVNNTTMLFLAGSFSNNVWQYYYYLP